MADPFDLGRFVRAQDPVLDQVRRELADGRKRSHWMWFVFPQLRGLGRSATARRYGIGSLAEAQAYLAHPVLGPRLVELTGLVNRVEGRSVHEIFGSGGGDYLAHEAGVPLLGKIPIEQAVATGGDDGKPVALQLGATRPGSGRTFSTSRL